MAKNKQAIINDIEKHFEGKDYGLCYIGITSDVQSRLFGDHKVSPKEGHDHWIYREANSHQVAREVEEEFIRRGMSGGEGGGDETTKIVYAYKKTSSTDP